MASAKNDPKGSSKYRARHTDKQHLFIRLREGALIGMFALGLYLLLALLTFDSADPSWSFTGVNENARNLMGQSGAWIASVLLFVFGHLAFLFPLLFGLLSWQMFRQRNAPGPVNGLMLGYRCLGFLLTLVAGTSIAAMHFYGYGLLFPEGSGGVLGNEIIQQFLPLFGDVGSTLVLLAALLIGFTAFMDISWFAVIERIGFMLIASIASAGRFWHKLRAYRKEKAVLKKSTRTRREAIMQQIEKNQFRPAVKIASPAKKQGPSERVAREKQGNLFKVAAVDGLPALYLLDAGDNQDDIGYSSADLDAMSRLLELKLKDYGVDAEVTAVFPGPVITRFEIQPAAGVKVSRITGLVKDLARSLAVISVRVVEVIPGKSVVGIEIPNVDRKMVRLGEVLSSQSYDQATSPLSLALGHDIAGEPIVVDLGKMPHMLVAGTTGSGKSVGINAMILSLLFKSSPEDVRLIMVDPKMLELAVYEGIPHLLTPVVTDMKDAANALRWCVAEMERRYRVMAAVGVRNIGGLNRKVKDAEKAGKPMKDPLWQADALSSIDMEEQIASDMATLPFIVVIIDEFADMMMIVGKKVEQLIARIAQKARAAGIHLILATQRPSVDVITGLIKANIPTRIAFQVSSKIDSRTILDQGGAEQLLGHGDMLYLPAGSALPVRVHGAFVDDDEVHRVVDSWRQLAGANYVEGILDPRSDDVVLPGGTTASSEESGEEQDVLYDEAVAFVTESRRVSISSVQRKLRIGYNRAARMIECMEVAGVISEMSANGTREVLANGPP